MQRYALLLLGSLLFTIESGAYAADSPWVQGTNYFLIRPTQGTNVAPGKVEVTEVFSYACPACNRFYPVIDRLRAALPPNAELDYLPASFRADEDWPVFQRAYYAAQLLGIDKRTHDAVFDAVWKTGELSIDDLQTHRPKEPPPNIEDLARFYARVAGVKPEAFIAAASSFGVDTKVRQADQLIMAEQVDQTPTIVVNGKYRITVGSAGGDTQLIQLVQWLVAQESASGMSPQQHK